MIFQFRILIFAFLLSATVFSSASVAVDQCLPPKQAAKVIQQLGLISFEQAANQAISEIGRGKIVEAILCLGEPPAYFFRFLLRSGRVQKIRIIAVS